VLFGGSQPLPPHGFALDAERLVGASFRREAVGLRLVERQSQPLPAGALALGPLGGPVAAPEVLAAAVAELVGRFAHRPHAASLVLPDAWARGLVVELGDLPEATEARREVLRFRLKKLVPFRTEELRVVASPIVAVAGQEDPVRALLLYASEALCAALESAFSAAGVRLGQIVNASLARLGALDRDGRLAGWVAVAAVESGGFTLVVVHDGEPVLWRQKSFADGLAIDDRGPLLAAELRLTRTFLAERLGVSALDAVLLEAPDDARAFWTDLLAAGLDKPALAIGASWLPLAPESERPGDATFSALVGAVSLELP